MFAPDATRARRLPLPFRAAAASRFAARPDRCARLARAVTAAGVLASLAGCSDSTAPDTALAPRDLGPVVRVEIHRGREFALAFRGAVRIASRSDDRTLYSGDLPSPCPVRLGADGRIEIGGHAFAQELRIACSDADSGAGLAAGTYAHASRGGGGASGGDPHDGDAAGGAAPDAVEAVAGADPAATGGSPADRGVGIVGAAHGTGPPAPRPRCALLVDDASPVEYRGAIELLRLLDANRQPTALLVVNAVRLEHYLLGVVGNEIPASYPIEAVRAQAIASRTYTLYALRTADERGDEIVVDSDTSFQVYRGLAPGEDTHPRVLDAVLATRGEVLAYQGRLFRSYFHSTCGGRTARADLTFGEAAIPPLEGGECGGCVGSRFAQWRSVVSRATLEAVVRARLADRLATVEFDRLVDIEIAATRPDGRVAYVRIEWGSGSLQWRADHLRFALDGVMPRALRSTAFVIHRGPDDAFTFEGRGWGHGVGLCQVGSGGLARRGLDTRTILERYYPLSELRQAY